MPLELSGMKMQTIAMLDMETDLIHMLDTAIGLAYLKVITYGSLSHFLHYAFMKIV